MHTTGHCRVCRDFGGRKPPKQKMAPRPEPEPKLEPSLPGNVEALPQGNPFGVREGQVWASVDPRDRGREIHVLEVDPVQGHATVLSHGKGGAKRRRIKLTGFTRLKGRGYELKPESGALAS